MATTTTLPITFAEFEQLPEPRDGQRLELRHGEPIKVPPAKYIHCPNTSSGLKMWPTP